MVVWFAEGKKAYMFNKLFTGTQLASGPVLAALSNHTPTDIKADYNDAYFNVKVESCSLEQLLSIYTISKEEAHV